MNPNPPDTESVRKRILLVDDDKDVGSLVKLHLSDFGFDVEVVEDGRLGLERGIAGVYVLIVLDVMLPSLDGLEVCKSLRRQGVLTPVLMLTARSSDIDKVLSLECGADDHLSKPFNLDELRARVRALIRRAFEWTESSPSTQIALGPLSIDMSRRKVTKGGVAIELTAKEFELLCLLAKSPGQVFSRDVLLERIWDYHSDVYGHTVTSHINRLRAKVEDDPANPRLITTVRGVGYAAQSG